jgi:hypothetical protein
MPASAQQTIPKVPQPEQAGDTDCLPPRHQKCFLYRLVMVGNRVSHILAHEPGQAVWQVIDSEPTDFHGLGTRSDRLTTDHATRADVLQLPTVRHLGL